MDRIERIKHVTEALAGQVERTQLEYDLTAAEIIGIIEILKLNLYHQACEEQDEEEE